MSEPDDKGVIGSIGLGLGLALLAQFLSFMLAGSGEGWNTPFWLSMFLWGLFPLALDQARAEGRAHKGTLVILALLAFVGDVLLIDGTLGERGQVLSEIRINGVLGVLLIGSWLILWFSWQFLAIRALIAWSRASR